MEDRTSSEVWLNEGCKLSFEVKVAKPMILCCDLAVARVSGWQQRNMTFLLYSL